MRYESDSSLEAVKLNATQALPLAPDYSASWYVAYTQPKQENVALVNLQQQGFRTYLPLYKILEKKAKKTAPQSDQPEPLVTYEPMFPRYIFFQPSGPKQSIAAARSTRGVNSMVRFGSVFALIQPEVIKIIQEHEQQRNQAKLHVISPFQPGRRVRLRDPALHRLEGLVHSVSRQRIIVLLEILGRQKMVRVEHNQVELT